uniref:Uncharacterized protein n=1 Tax=Anopheles stephensi TaxID=30069 RepID=A0A182YN62_ANOST
MYRRDWPQHEIIYNWLQNYIEWLRIDRKLEKFVALSLNDTWRENGTFVIQIEYALSRNTRSFCICTTDVTISTPFQNKQ